MTTQSHYEINVTLKGRYLFSTSERAALDEMRAKFIFDQICMRFPKSEGFDHTCTFWGCSGIPVEFKH